MTDSMKERSACDGCNATPDRLLATFEASREDTIGRRMFLVQSGILAAIGALNACGGLGGADVTSPNVPANSSITISDYPALANVGGVAMITLGAVPIAVVRTGASSFIALSRVCPHQGGIVELSRNDFVCPNHGATFDLSGKWIGGQRTSSLHQYTTAYDGASGRLTIS